MRLERTPRPWAALGAVAVLPALLAAMATSPQRARADIIGAGSGPTEVYNVSGSAAGIAVTVKSGYSFVAEPNGQVPRALATVAADTSTALASPGDPGDGVDSLPGLAVPVATGCILPPLAQGLSKLPPPFGDTAVAVVNSANPTLTYPYEHAYVQYPSPSGQPQTAVLGTGANVSDPSGTVGADATTGRAHADKGVADAEAGAGSAVTSLPIGLKVGRVVSTANVRGLGGDAIGDATTTVQDINLTPPQLTLPPGVAGPLLHIGSLVVTAHSERRAGAALASGRTSVEYSGVTFAGQPATIDHNGVVVLGHPVVALQQLTDAFNGLVGVGGGSVPPSPPAGLPKPPPGYQSPGPRMTPPVVSDQVTHNGNEDTARVSGLTLTFATPVPVPTVSGFPPSGCSVPKPPSGPPSVNPTAATYIVTIGDVGTSAYRLTLPGDTGAVGATLPVAPIALTPPAPEPAVSSGSVAAPPADTGSGSGAGVGTGTTGAGAPAAATPRHAGLAGFLYDNAVLNRPVVVSLAGILEVLLLLTLTASYRRAARGGRGLDPPTMDLV